MIFFIKLLVSAAALLGAMKSSCASPTGTMDENKRALGEVEAALAEPLLKLTSKLMRATNKEGKNLILSPVSIHNCLSIVLLGADDKSLTQSELINLLGHENGTGVEWHKSYTKLIELFDSITKEKKKAEQEQYPQDRGVEIQMYNVAIEKNFNIEATYLKQLNEIYKSTVEKVTRDEDIYRISAKVNKWAKDAGFNSDLLTPDQFQSDHNLLMLLSAIKLQAYWFDDFAQIKQDDFFHNYGKIDQVAKDSIVLQRYDIQEASYIEFTTKPVNPNHRDFIDNIKSVHSTAYKKLSNLEFRAIKVRMHGDVSFTIIEPLNHENGQELADLEKRFWDIEDEMSGANNFITTMKLIDSVEAKTRLEYLKMPGYNFETDIDLKQLLESIGVTRIFSEREAELTRIGSPKLYVRKANHKAMIEVNKQGIKASGATILKLTPTSLQTHHMKIKVDVRNPYFFVLRYGELPLFVGHLVHLEK